MLFDLKIKHVFVFPYSNPLDALRASVPHDMGGDGGLP
jgi:hypothetical protein